MYSSPRQPSPTATATPARPTSAKTQVTTRPHQTRKHGRVNRSSSRDPTNTRRIGSSKSERAQGLNCADIQPRYKLHPDRLLAQVLPRGTDRAQDKDEPREDDLKRLRQAGSPVRGHERESQQVYNDERKDEQEPLVSGKGRAEEPCTVAPDAALVLVAHCRMRYGHVY